LTLPCLDCGGYAAGASAGAPSPALAVVNMTFTGVPATVAPAPSGLYLRNDDGGTGKVRGLRINHERNR
jgi:hypothetical protein